MTTAPHAAPVVILSAVPEERERLGAMVAEPQDRTMAGTVVRMGTLDDIPVAIAACGIGTIAAAAVAAVLCDRLAPAEHAERLLRAPRKHAPILSRTLALTSRRHTTGADSHGSAGARASATTCAAEYAMRLNGCRGGAKAGTPCKR